MEDRSKPKKFTVVITETLLRKIEVSANSKEEAEAKAEEMYENSEIVLDASDFNNYGIDVLDN